VVSGTEVKPTAGEDTTSGEAEGGKPQAPSSQSTSPEPVREGEELREDAVPAKPAADVEYPSRRPCLHLLGTNSVYRDHNGTQVRVEVCTQCGMVIEEIPKATK